MIVFSLEKYIEQLKDLHDTSIHIMALQVNENGEYTCGMYKIDKKWAKELKDGTDKTV